MTQPQTELSWNRRFRAWLRQNWLLDTAWRITVFFAGVTLMSIGVLLLVLPGPGWAMIALGLIVLASEYVWAQRLLRPVKSKLQAAKAHAQNPQNRNQMRFVTAGAFVLMGAAVGAYVWRYGISLDGVRSLWPL